MSFLEIAFVQLLDSFCPESRERTWIRAMYTAVTHATKPPSKRFWLYPYERVLFPDRGQDLANYERSLIDNHRRILERVQHNRDPDPNLVVLAFYSGNPETADHLPKRISNWRSWIVNTAVTHDLDADACEAALGRLWPHYYAFTAAMARRCALWDHSQVHCVDERAPRGGERGQSHHGDSHRDASEFRSCPRVRVPPRHLALEAIARRR